MAMKFFASVFLFVGFQILAQELLFERVVNLSFKGKKAWQTFHHHNFNNNQHGIFFVKGDQIKSYFLDSTFHFLSRKSVKTDLGKYKRPLGVNATDMIYDLVFANKKNQSTLQVISFNALDSSIKVEVVPTKLGRHKLIGTFMYKNNLFLFSIIKNSSILVLTHQNANKEWVSREIDFSENTFFEGNFGKLYTALFTNTNKFKVDKMESEIPASLELVSSPNKWYVIGNKVYLTVDNNVYYTQVLSISLDDDTKEYKKITFPGLAYHPDFLMANSFLIENTIFQVKSCKDSLMLVGTDIQTSEVLLNESLVRKKEMPPFKLTVYSNKFHIPTLKRKNNASLFLRKSIRSTNIGVSVFDCGNESQVLVGCYKHKSKTIHSHHSKAATNPFWLYRKNIYIAPGNIRFMPVLGRRGYLDSYSYFEEKRDSQTLQRLNTTSVSTPFFKIQEFNKSLKGKYSCSSYYSYNGNVLYGYYDEGKGVYSLLKFLE